MVNQHRDINVFYGHVNLRIVFRNTRRVKSLFQGKSLPASSNNDCHVMRTGLHVLKCKALMSLFLHTKNETKVARPKN